MTIECRMNVDIKNSIDPEIAIKTYSNVARFKVHPSCLTPHGVTLLSWGQLSPSFIFSIGSIQFDKEDIDNALDGLDLGTGAGPGGTRPTCLGGFAFEKMQVKGIFGQFYIPQSHSCPTFNFSFGLVEPIVSSSINIGTNPQGGRGQIVASGTVEFVLV